MKETLQDLFIKSQGQPIKVGDMVVVQLDQLPLHDGVVFITFLSPQNSNQGVCLKTNGGAIHLSDGSITEKLYIWNTPGLPRFVKHKISCAHREVLLWNIYRVIHPSGQVTEDQWTGNAGMVLVEESSHMRRFVCSDWKTPFDPSAIEFEVQWEHEIKRQTKDKQKGSG